MRKIICPNGNCGYQGKPKKVARGSVVVGLFLLAFGVLPGILYFALKSGYRYFCPKCGVQVGSDS